MDACSGGVQVTGGVLRIKLEAACCARQRGLGHLAREQQTTVAGQTSAGALERGHTAWRGIAQPSTSARILKAVSLTAWTPSSESGL